MKLERMHLRNFRCFKELTIDFDGRLTVFAAENGAGKTALLDAIAIGFGRYLTKLPGIAGISIKDTDLRITKNEKYVPLVMMAWEACTYDNTNIVWAASRKRDGAITRRDILSEKYRTLLSYGMKNLDNYTLSLAQAEADQENYFLPVITYYGTNRAIREEVHRRRGFKKKFTRMDALYGALAPDSSFRAAFEWFNAMEDAERRERETRRNFDYQLTELKIVRDAIVRMLPGGFSNPRTEIRPLRFVIDHRMPDDTLQTLRISQLSEGYRVILGLTMDLARRMAEANSTMVPDVLCDMSPLDLPAIVLIDEVDLHLHPSWQQHVLGDLMQTFRNTQFIVTTHSPQVISTVPSECIRILRGGGVFAAPPGTEGAEPGRVLRQVQGLEDVRPLSSQATRELKEYLALVDRDLWQSPRALELRVKLDARYQGNEPALLEADLHIENRKWELEE